MLLLDGNAKVSFAAVEGSAKDTCWTGHRQGIAAQRFDVFRFKGKVATFFHTKKIGRIANKIRFTS